MSKLSQMIAVVALFGFFGVTDIDESSAGYRIALNWGDLQQKESQLTVGHDLRYLDGALNYTYTVATIESDLAIVKGKVPDQSHAMTDPESCGEPKTRRPQRPPRTREADSASRSIALARVAA